MASIWANGRLKAVYHQIGKHANGQPKYRRAQFDFLIWDSDGDGVPEQYVNVGYTETAASEINDTGQEHEVGSFFGFYEPGYEILDPHGHHDEKSWPALHAFGFY